MSPDASLDDDALSALLPELQGLRRELHRIEKGVRLWLALATAAQTS